MSQIPPNAVPIIRQECTAKAKTLVAALPEPIQSQLRRECAEDLELRVYSYLGTSWRVDALLAVATEPSLLKPKIKAYVDIVFTDEFRRSWRERVDLERKMQSGAGTPDEGGNLVGGIETTVAAAEEVYEEPSDRPAFPVVAEWRASDNENEQMFALLWDLHEGKKPAKGFPASLYEPHKVSEEDREKLREMWKAARRSPAIVESLLDSLDVERFSRRTGSIARKTGRGSDTRSYNMLSKAGLDLITFHPGFILRKADAPFLQCPTCKKISRQVAMGYGPADMQEEIDRIFLRLLNEMVRR